MNTVVLKTDSSSDLKLIIALAKKLRIKVLPLSQKQVEEIEDLQLLLMMQDAQKEGLADTDEVLSKLGLK